MPQCNWSSGPRWRDGGGAFRSCIIRSVSPVWAGQINTKIVLVDGRTLARLMILHDVGCSPAQTYVVKKLDSDSFFEE